MNAQFEFNYMVGEPQFHMSSVHKNIIEPENSWIMITMSSI